MGGGTPLWPSIVTSLLPGLCTLDRGVGGEERVFEHKLKFSFDLKQDTGHKVFVMSIL